MSTRQSVNFYEVQWVGRRDVGIRIVAAFTAQDAIVQVEHDDAVVNPTGWAIAPVRVSHIQPATQAQRQAWLEQQHQTLDQYP